MSSRETPGSRKERRRQQRRQEVARLQRRESGKRMRYIAAAVAVLIVLLAGGVYFAMARGNDSGPAAQGQPGEAISGVQCQAEMTMYHIHAHLTLYENGQPVALPALIGIPASTAIQNANHSCLYWLHTHDTRGVVHIESPERKSFTLGQFLDIWRSTSTWDAQGGLGITVDASFANALARAKPSDIHVYVGARPVAASAYRNILLTAHEVITIEIGKPLKAPDTHYAFQPYE